MFAWKRQLPHQRSLEPPQPIRLQSNHVHLANGERCLNLLSNFFQKMIFLRLKRDLLAKAFLVRREIDAREKPIIQTHATSGDRPIDSAKGDRPSSLSDHHFDGLSGCS
ncbi:MAG: hypothetical protein AAGA75_04790 [Cyanobacteria bacterium P01_E01_bin.6]